MSNSMNNLRHLASLATRATERALSYDEQGRRSDAERGYERAASVLRRALNIHVRFPGYSERPQIGALRGKLEKHLGMVEGRLSAIRKGLRGEKGDGKVVGEWETEMEKRIENEILDKSPGISWEDVSGLDGVKAALKEMVVLPAKRPDLYQGLRAPAKGMLLFGPSGTGKSLVAKAVASESEATFFSISASSFASKYHGESEQLMKALFQVAKKRQPSFIFIDEIDSILGKRGGDEHEASRKLKTEFLCMFDGATTATDDRIFIMAASNRPQDLDEAVRRRLPKRFYVPLPDTATRFDMMKKLRDKPGVAWNVSDGELWEVAATLRWFSGSDVNALCKEAVLMPLRDLGADVHNIATSSVRPVVKGDLLRAKDAIRPNTSRQQLAEFDAWTQSYGTRTPGTLRRSHSSTMPVQRTNRSTEKRQSVAAAARNHTRTRSAETEYTTRRSSRTTSSSGGSSSRSPDQAPRPPRPHKSSLRRQLSSITDRGGKSSGRRGRGGQGGTPRTTRRHFFD